MSARPALAVAALALAAALAGCRSGQPMRELIPPEFAEDVAATDEPYETMTGLTPGSVVLMPMRLKERHIGFDSLRGDAEYDREEGVLELRGELIASPDMPDVRWVHMALFLAPPPPEGEDLNVWRALAEEPIAKATTIEVADDGLTYEARFPVPEEEVPWGGDPSRDPVALVSVFFMDEQEIAVREVLQIPLAPLPAAFPPPR